VHAVDSNFKEISLSLKFKKAWGITYHNNIPGIHKGAYPYVFVFMCAETNDCAMRSGCGSQYDIVTKRYIFLQIPH